MSPTNSHKKRNYATFENKQYVHYILLHLLDCVKVI